MIVTGGATWQATAAGLDPLLPMDLAGSETTSDLELLALLGDGQVPRGETLVATGSLRQGAQVLAESAAGLPLLVRWTVGLGTVDYLTMNPLTEPLRSWSGLNSLWHTLALLLGPQPSWSRRGVDYDRAINATEILPGLNLLPDVLPLCGFLLVYIMLIGPLNYVVLRRINRREFAWVTISLLIVIFSALAWLVGFNLRGNEVNLSRLAVVQSWPDLQEAQVDGLIGILSPRRASYTLTMTDDSLLRPLPRSIPNNPIVANVQASTDIEQSDQFRAEDFSVDASFIATFSSSSHIERPAISGQASMFYERAPAAENSDATDHWSLRGSISNDSDFTLYDPVILARGTSLMLNQALEPGDVQAFELALSSDEPPSPSPLEYGNSSTSGSLLLNRVNDANTNEQTIRDILGPDVYNRRILQRPQDDGTQVQENRRRQLLLTAMMTDEFQATARGDHVYLAGWADAMPLATDLGDASWTPIDTTLHLIELSVEVVKPAGTVRITPDQFTWAAEERPLLATSIAPVNGYLQPGDEAIFRFTPLADFVLKQVDTLYLTMDTRNNIDSYPVELWDRVAQNWEGVQLTRDESTMRFNTLALRNPQRFLGVQNSIQVRLRGDAITNSSGLMLTRFLVEEEGSF